MLSCPTDEWMEQEAENAREASEDQTLNEYCSGRATGREIKVAALIGLGDVLGAHALVQLLFAVPESGGSYAAFPQPHRS